MSPFVFFSSKFQSLTNSNRTPTLKLKLLISILESRSSLHQTFIFGKMSAPTTITVVEPAPPRFHIFPNEVLYKIFAYALLDPKGPVNAKWFYFMVKVGMFSKLLRASRQFAELAKLVFYEVNEFDFSYKFPDHWTCYKVPRGPPLPPSWTFGLLRRIKLQIHLADSWLQPIVRTRGICHRTPPRTVHFFQSAIELLNFCPGARILQFLTYDMTALKVLDLHIVENFRNEDIQASLDVYRSACFAVRVAELKLVITNIERHPDEPESVEAKAWYPELRRAIGL